MSAPRGGRRRISPVPPQHGAWAFVGLPVAAALTVSPWTPVLVLLIATWVLAYPASYFVLALARDSTSRHPDRSRYLAPLGGWWAVTLACGLPLLVLRPWLLWVALVFAASFAVNLAFARRRNERALVNDAVFIAQCAVMVPVTWMVAVGGGTFAPPGLASAPTTVWVLTIAVALLLVGSTLHVKSLIRERSDPRFARASRLVAMASAMASLGLAAWWGLPAGLLLVVPFAYFAVRSAVIRDAPRPARIGMVELVGFMLLVVASGAAVAWGDS